MVTHRQEEARPGPSGRIIASRRRSRWRLPGTHAPGMSLGELVMVVLLISTIAAMATPYLIEARSRYRFDHGAREVLRGLQRARFEAIRRNETIDFTRLSPTRFEVEGIGEFDIPGGVEFSSGPTTIQFASFGPVVGGAVAPIVLSNGDRTAEIVINLSGYASLY